MGENNQSKPEVFEPEVVTPESRVATICVDLRRLDFSEDFVRLLVEAKAESTKIKDPNNLKKAEMALNEIYTEKWANFVSNLRRSSSDVKKFASELMIFAKLMHTLRTAGVVRF